MSFDPMRFLAAYSAAFASGTPEEIAVFYHVPCLSIRGDRSVHVFHSSGEVTQFFGSVLATYRAEGMAHFKADNLAVEALGAASARLSCDWAMQRADRSTLRGWRQTYIFHRGDDGWRIAVSLFHVGDG